MINFKVGSSFQVYSLAIPKCTTLDSGKTHLLLLPFSALAFQKYKTPGISDQADTQGLRTETAYLISVFDFKLNGFKLLSLSVFHFRFITGFPNENEKLPQSLP